MGLTAYVITSLIEGAADLPSRVIRNSLSCLRAFPLSKSKSHAGVYAHSLLAYALMRLRNHEEDLKRTNEAYLREKEVASGLMEDEELRELVLLLKLAKRNKEYVYWESGMFILVNNSILSCFDRERNVLSVILLFLYRKMINKLAVT